MVQVVQKLNINRVIFFYLSSLHVIINISMNYLFAKIQLSFIHTYIKQTWKRNFLWSLLLFASLRVNWHLQTCFAFSLVSYVMFIINDNSDSKISSVIGWFLLPMKRSCKVKRNCTVLPCDVFSKQRAKCFLACIQQSPWRLIYTEEESECKSDGAFRWVLMEFNVLFITTIDYDCRFHLRST